MKMRDMELLVRVAEAGSMTLAAQQLHLTPAAVSGAVQRIEGQLGVRLFERTTRSLRPTDEGQVVVEGCQELLGRWQGILEEMRGQRAELEGEVHLSAPADTTYQILGDVVADLCGRHPGLQVVLHVSDAIQHLHRDAIDVAIRYGRLQDSGLTARKLVALPGVLVASPGYLAAEGAPEAPEALAGRACLTLQLAGSPALTWRLVGPGGEREIALERPLCGDGYLVRRWALGGRGIALKSLFDVIDDLEAGRLAQVLPGWRGGDSAIHAVFPSRRFLPARVRALDAAIAARFAARAERCRAWLEAGGG